MSATSDFVGCLLTNVSGRSVSAVASAFIIQVDSQLQPDSGDETAALLRVLIYKIDNTTFGTNVPTIPQWSGPPPAIVHVQALLFTSLAASLLSALLAMLGKQWLNRYASTDMQGSAIERSQNRKRKLDGIIRWYFDSVMESLPLMLQVALLLLGCALSRYLWEANINIASVVIGFTSFVFLFYIFIVIAGTIWDSCPYQTPGSTFFRYLGSTVREIFLSLGRTVQLGFAESEVTNTAPFGTCNRCLHSWASSGRAVVRSPSHCLPLHQQDAYPVPCHSETEVGSPTNLVGLPMHFVVAPNIPRKTRTPLSPPIPHHHHRVHPL